MNIADLIRMKKKEHGDYPQVSQRFLRIASAALGGTHPDKLKPEYQTAVYMISMKLARIAEGDPGLLDHWIDIQGYAELAARACTEPASPAEEKELHDSIAAALSTEYTMGGNTDGY